MIQKPVDKGQPIPTRTLPARCPACGRLAPSYRVQLDTRVSVLSCVCGYEQPYLVRP